MGSYSTLIGHYVKQTGHKIHYVDPLADDPADVIADVNWPAVILMAHNRRVTYGYTGAAAQDKYYFNFAPGSVIVDPWRQEPDKPGMEVVHYGNTRNRQV